DAGRGERVVQLDLVGGERLDLHDLSRAVRPRDVDHEGVRLRGVAGPVDVTAGSFDRGLELQQVTVEIGEHFLLDRRSRVAQVFPVGQLAHRTQALDADRLGR